jgi:hypothetical protein
MSLDFYLLEEKPVEVFTANITHNLAEMADAAGIYEPLWRPEAHGYKRARDIIDVLENGLTAQTTRPEHFKSFDAPNGWGTYAVFVGFVEEVLEACRSNPDAIIESSR